MFDDLEKITSRVVALTLGDIAQLKAVQPSPKRCEYSSTQDWVQGSLNSRRKIARRLNASLLEEIGELATTLKVELGVVSHKKLDEDSRSESTDVWVCGVMMAVVGGVKVEDLVIISLFREEEKVAAVQNAAAEQPDTAFEILHNLAKTAGVISLAIDNDEWDETTENERLVNSGLMAANYALQMYVNRQGDPAAFSKIVNAKLDKWEKNYNERKAE